MTVSEQEESAHPTSRADEGELKKKTLTDFLKLKFLSTSLQYSSFPHKNLTCSSLFNLFSSSCLGAEA
jgi:hypothetical protein